MRRIAIPILLALVLTPAAEAKKQLKRPPLAITSLTQHAGKRIGAGERFRVTGTIRNNGRSASPALVSATLRRGGKTAFVLGAANVKRIRAHHSHRFTLRATGPEVPAGKPTRRYVLQTCVRARRGGGRVCRQVRRPVAVVPASPGGGPGGTPQPPTGSFTAGSRSAGDRLFPTIGNGGYDARHYDLALSYDPATKRLDGTATIDVAATQDLSELSFDLYNMPVTSVLVGGQPATFKQEAGKLIVTPPHGIASGATFAVTVAYGTAITAYTDPDGSNEGWVSNDDGAFVVNEPVGAMSWFPNNNVPTDKATYDISVTVPASLEVIGNGRLASNTPSADGKHRTWHWVESQPMASYLVTATNGEFDFTPPDESQPAPAYYAIDSSYNPLQKAQMTTDLSQTPAIVAFYADFLATPYPFDAMGGVVDKSDVGYALETQTKPMYAVNSTPSPGLATISHELAHQWFGDDVSPATWSDIWLNEGPAEFFSWLWQERSGNSPLTTQQRFDTNYASPAMNWSIPPAAPPTAADMFDTDAMYTRGAMVMEALREILGEEKFKTVLAHYLAAHKYDNASTKQFIEIVKAEGGKDPAKLGVFFREWLYGSEKPGITPSNFDTYTAP